MKSWVSIELVLEEKIDDRKFGKSSLLLSCEGLPNHFIDRTDASKSTNKMYCRSSSEFLCDRTENHRLEQQYRSFYRKPNEKPKPIPPGPLSSTAKTKNQKNRQDTLKVDLDHSVRSVK